MPDTVLKDVVLMVGSHRNSVMLEVDLEHMYPVTLPTSSVDVNFSGDHPATKFESRLPHNDISVSVERCNSFRDMFRDMLCSLLVLDCPIYWF